MITEYLFEFISSEVYYSSYSSISKYIIYVSTFSMQENQNDCKESEIFSEKTKKLKTLNTEHFKWRIVQNIPSGDVKYENQVLVKYIPRT